MLLPERMTTASLETWALTSEEADFFRAGDELEAVQAIETLVDLDENCDRSSLWQRLFYKTER